ncbi:probable BOI-related E3 ubiquitin-protein ligase 3 [Impatiens glandulifera]|uniref:probable BOI-related E3 ubiquitin-protein ligase 3 n=1 Tax=Impatiens glandulifera TaxID=253017 RepID=UPI001FB16BF1|nr:probable BOI-related E3 ubiquitin-protein ligase 3 [Impatiens glandulifera]
MAVDAPPPVGFLNPQFLAGTGTGTGIKRSRDLLTDDSSEQISLMIKQQQIEIDSIIVQHARRLRIEIEGRRIQQTRMLISAVREGICRKMHDKEEEIKRIGRNTLFLEDKLKILCFENQSLRDLALTNEAAAISLRRSLAESRRLWRVFPASG